MNCKEYRAFVSNPRLGGNLMKLQQAEKHVKDCAACKRWVEKRDKK